jgi:hypothetical protein
MTNADVIVPTGGVLGVANASSATAGNVGQVISSLIPNGSSISLGNGTAANVTSIILTAGDWDVSGTVSFAAGAATITQMTAGMSTSTGTLPTDGTEGYSDASITTSTLTNSITLTPIQVNVNASTTVFLVGKCAFSAGTVREFGFIRARRMR